MKTNANHIYTHGYNISNNSTQDNKETNINTAHIQWFLFNF